MAECLICKKETENENQICNNCLNNNTPKKNETKKKNKLGLISLYLGISALVFVLFESPICNTISLFPVIGQFLGTFLSVFSIEIQITLGVFAIVLGNKAKKTDNETKGKIGKILAIVALAFIPVIIAINTIKITILLIMVMLLLVAIIAPAFLLEIVALLSSF